LDQAVGLIAAAALLAIGVAKGHDEAHLADSMKRELRKSGQQANLSQSLDFSIGDRPQ
jgi:hypothetical protein